MSERRIRAAVVRVVDRGAETTVIGARGVARLFAGDSAALVRAVLEICARAVTRDELFGELAARTGGELPAGSAAQVIDELLAILDADQVLVAAVAAPLAPPLIRRVVLGVCGAVAAVDAPA